jgi:hypothetical protein
VSFEDPCAVGSTPGLILLKTPTTLRIKGGGGERQITFMEKNIYGLFSMHISLSICILTVTNG